MNVDLRSLARKSACAALFLWTMPAWANLENTVTVRGASAAGEVVAETRLEISVVRAAPGLTVAISANPASGAATGDSVQLTYRLENTGNVTLSSLRLQIEQEGAGAAPVLQLAEAENTERAMDETVAESEETGLAYPGTLAPGEAAEFTARYVVVQDDLEQNGGGDGMLESRATAMASFAGSETRAEGSFQIELEEIRATLEVAKTADRMENVAAGDVITYTYTITNTGNVTITSISLTETHTGSGPAPRPAGEQLLTDNGTIGDSTDREADGSWDILGPQDVITFTGTYTVTQSDVDTLQ